MLDTRIVYLEPSKLTIDTMTLPDLKPTEVLVKTHQASVCGSERYFYQGITVRPEDEAKGGSEVQLGDHYLDIIFENSVTHRLSEIADVCQRENAQAVQQNSLKTLIIP